MSAEHRQFGPYPYGHSSNDIFLDDQAGTVNFQYFARYFDEVSLPMDIAKKCLGDHYSQWGGRTRTAPQVRFVKLSSLRKYGRLLPYHELRDELVEHTQISSFTLSGPLTMWPREALFEKTPCIFVSHRWQSYDHPDPDGTHLQLIIERLDGLSPQRQATAHDEIYVWIDYCCLPQKRGPHALSPEDLETLHAGLEFLSQIVKSCDLLILYSQDYLDRVWCYTEIFVWLAKVAEQNSHSKLIGRPLFDSILTRSGASGNQTTGGSEKTLLPLHDFIVRNLVYRGFGGASEEAVAIFEPIFDYCHTAIDSASYTLGAYEAEYIPNLVRFMCNTWYEFQQKGCSCEEDVELCLYSVVNSLKFINGL